MARSFYGDQLSHVLEPAFDELEAPYLVSLISGVLLCVVHAVGFVLVALAAYRWSSYDASARLARASIISRNIRSIS